MGTNYYVIKNNCPHCKRCDEEYHIGKASYGWAFSFQGYPYMKLTSWKQWKEFLKDQQIQDEYGEAVAYTDFVEMVENYKSPTYKHSDGRKNLVHNDEGRRQGYYRPDRDWDDEDGYSFTITEFS